MMNAVAQLPVSIPRPMPWDAFLHYEIGPVDASLSFARRLARENGWTMAHAERVIVEYRRFLYLAAHAGFAVTPSDAVDQAWHLHLTYSRDYWDRLCPDLIGRPLHHGPTRGGDGEEHRFFEAYAQTLKSYAATFGTAAPRDLWPPAAQRLRDDPRARRVHPRDGLIVSRRMLVAMLLVAAAAGALVMLLLAGG